MSDRVLRQPLSLKGSASMNYQKRKSSDDELENNENVSPNVSMKKLRSKDASVENSGGALSSDQKLKSGLPRYHRPLLKAVPNITPGKTKLRGNIQPGTPISIVKRVGRHSSCNSGARRACNDKIGAYFDQGLSINENKITEIMSVLKVKGKKQPFVDFKEKSKKYELVIKELRDALKVVLAEIPTLREKSVAHESFITGIIYEMDADVRETNGLREALEIKESLLSEELKIVNDELKSTAGLAESLRREHSPLRNHSQKVEQLYSILKIEFAEECASHQSAQSEVFRLTAALSEASMSLSSNEQLRVQELAEVVSSSTDEIHALSVELESRSAIAEKAEAERLDICCRVSEYREEIQRNNNTIREHEIASNRHCIESKRLESDLERSKTQLEQKDEDLRQAMNALAGERLATRTDMGALQTRITQLEQERIETVWQLAGKREESLSMAREIQQLNENILDMKSKSAARDADLVVGQEAIQQLEISNKLLSIMEVREEAERRERVACSAQLLATQTQCSHQLCELEERMSSNTVALRNEINSISALRDLAVAEVREKSDAAMRLESEVQQLKRSLEDASISSETVEALAKLTGECEVLKRRIREASERKEFEGSATADRIGDLTERMRLGEIQRRKLHNLVQELRGNVRVFARVRPFLPSDGIDLTIEPSPPTSIAVRSDDVSMRISRAGGGAHSGVGVERAEEHSFTFDRTFGPSSSQESVFQEVSEFVQSALDGYNVCLFSYGQTGSGKTHTMAGSGTGSMRGIIPRAIQQVGAYKTELEGKGWEYHMEVSFIEIYNETIRDLLRGTQAEEGKHEIKKDVAGNMFVSDVTMAAVDPNDDKQMDGILELAARHRSVEKTAMNERSSRSHSVFTLHLCASNPSQGVVLRGTLSLVDLAGSERLDRSGAAGARMKETVAINKSLSSLVDVFAAIGNKQSHIPFRNSKLTYLLSPALSGDGKTLMMVNLSPTEESYFESLCSLRFASQVNQCELGKPKRQLKDAHPESSTHNLSSAVASDKEKEKEKERMQSGSTSRLPASGMRKPRERA